MQQKEWFFHVLCKELQICHNQWKSYRLEKVGKIKLTLLNKLDMTLLNIALALRCNFNLIFFGQLKETRISYHDHLKSMIFIKAGNIIGSIQKTEKSICLGLAKQYW